MFSIEMGNVISSCVICSANAGKYLYIILQRLTFTYFEKVAELSSFAERF